MKKKKIDEKTKILELVKGFKEDEMKIIKQYYLRKSIKCSLLALSSLYFFMISTGAVVLNYYKLDLEIILLSIPTLVL